MTAFLGAFLTAAFVALLATPLARGLARRWRAVDSADGTRKLQEAPIPYLGGAALFVALACGTLVCCAREFAEGFTLPTALLLSSAIICFVGWLDDRCHLRVRWKLLGQIAATFPLALAGPLLERIEFAGFVCELGWWGIPLSVGWLVACANALNFIDGSDGLAAAVGLVAAAATALIAERLGHHQSALLAAVLAGGLSGFLFFNWQPATIYLGDSGSMTVGLWLAAVATGGSRTPELGSRLVVLMALFAIPLADLALAVVRRQLSGLPFWIADRAHLHHRLLDRGLPASTIAALLSALSVLTGGIAFAAAVHGRELLAWCALALVALAAVRYELAGTHELEVARQLVARRLLDLFALVSTGRAAGQYPRPEHLAGLPISAAWELFVTRIEQHQVETLEVVLIGRDTSSHYRWRPTLSVFGDAQWCTLEVAIRGPEGQTCRLCARVREGTATAPLNWFLLAQTLRTHAAHYADHAAALSTALAAGNLPNVITLDERAAA